MSTETCIVDTQWMSCVQPVHNTRIVQRHQTTRLQGVQPKALPVCAATLVYAGQQRFHPQSTALITAISMYTSDSNNQNDHQQRITT